MVSYFRECFRDTSSYQTCESVQTWEGACLGDLLEGPRGQTRVCVVTALDRTHEARVCDLRVLKVKQGEKRSSASKQVKTNLRGKIKLSAGTGQIRVKIHHERIGAIGVGVVLGLLRRGPGDIAINAVVRCSLDPDDFIVMDLPGFRVWLGHIRRVSTADRSA